MLLGNIFLFYMMPFATNKPHHSTYPRTPSGNPKTKHSLCFWFGLFILHLFFLSPKKGLFKNIDFKQPHFFYCSSTLIYFSSYDSKPSPSKISLHWLVPFVKLFKSIVALMVVSVIFSSKYTTTV